MIACGKRPGPLSRVYAVRDLNIPHAGSPFGVETISLGIATARPGAGDSPSWLVHLADDVRHAAKRAGRNTIETSGRKAARERILT